MQSQKPGAMNPLMMSLSLHWLESWRCAAELNRRSLEEMRRMRSRMLQDVSFCMESYMRSPAFLGLMRHNMMMTSQGRRPMTAEAPSTSVAVMGHPKGEVDGVARVAPQAMVDHLKEVLADGDLSISKTSMQEQG